MLYRVLKSLSTGHKPGDLVDGARFQYLDVLVKVGALAKVKPPPLSELPGWKARAEKLAESGIETLQDFLEADDEILKAIFNHKTTRAISKWRAEVKDWLVANGPKKKR